MKEHEWDAAHVQYVTGAAKDDGTRYYPSMAEVARDFNVSLSAVSHRAASERWFEEREEFRRKVYESAVAQYESEFSRLLARADLDAAYAAADLIHHIRRQIERGTEAERTSLAKTISKPLRELIDIVHRAVGIEQGVEREQEGDAA